MHNYQVLWSQTRNILKNMLDLESFEDTFSDVTQVNEFKNGIIYILTPNIYIKTKINTCYIEQANQILDSLTNEKLKFKFVCLQDLENTKEVMTNNNRLNINNLNENYNFQSFVVGESNRFAYVMSMNVAEQPDKIANPLYIFGGVGLGKTHLMQSIGNYILDKNINNKILYVQANDFIVDYSKATKQQSMEEFEEKYSNLDALLVDDIQMLEIGKKSQHEFFKLFNDLINRKKQIVITSDCPANQLKGIMDRLTSRFQSGMNVDIKQPDLEQRVNILKRKAIELTQLKINEDVLYYIAENFTNNVRELEGALKTVVLTNGVLQNDCIDIDICKKALSSILKTKELSDNFSYENLLSVVAAFYAINVNDLISSKRKQQYVLPRHIAMYLLKTKYNLSYKKIGEILGNRDHSTVMNGVNKMEIDVKNSDELKLALDTIEKKLT